MADTDQGLLRIAVEDMIEEQEDLRYPMGEILDMMLTVVFEKMVKEYGNGLTACQVMSEVLKQFIGIHRSVERRVLGRLH